MKSKNIILSTVIAALFLISFPAKVSAQTPDARFSLQPNSATFIQEAQSVINIQINTGSNTSNAADIIINYNPNEIEIIQVGPGSAYESYAGTVIDTSAGRIRLTGFSITGTLSGSRIFGTIKFRSKPGVSSSNLTIQFAGVGNTLDSNIAETNTSNDVLGSVGNGSYNFIPAPPPPEPVEPPDEGPADTTNPVIEPISPQNYETDIPLDSNIIVKISDDGSGVNIETVIIIINGEAYTCKDTDNFSYEGDPNSYTVIITPKEPFGENTPIFVIIKANDLKGNYAQEILLFNVPAEAADCFDEIRDKLQDLEKCKEDLAQYLAKGKGLEFLPLTGSVGKLSQKLGITIPGLFSLLALMILIFHTYWRNPGVSDPIYKLLSKSKGLELSIFIIGAILMVLGIVDNISILSILTAFLYIFAVIDGLINKKGIYKLFEGKDKLLLKSWIIRIIRAALILCLTSAGIIGILLALEYLGR